MAELQHQHRGSMRPLGARVYPFLRQVPRPTSAPPASTASSHPAVSRNVASPTQNRALSAPLFHYREVLNQPLGWVGDVGRAKRPKRPPVVFTREEAKAVLSHPRGGAWLMDRSSTGRACV